MSDETVLEAIAISGTRLVEGGKYVVTVPDDYEPDMEFIKAVKKMFEEAGAKGFVLSLGDVRSMTDQERAWYEAGYNDGVRSTEQ